MTSARLWLVTMALAVAPAVAAAEDGQGVGTAKGCDELFRVPGIVWRGTSASMALQQLAAYAAPVFWFSPDEPLNGRRSGRNIRLPEPFPFDTRPESPVVYYQVTRVDGLQGATGPAVTRHATDPGQSILNFDAVTSLQLTYSAYFSEEAGLGQHHHDIEQAHFRILVGRANGDLARFRGFHCDSPDYLIIVNRVTGDAHGNAWYANVLDVDSETRFPVHLLVEEGKHAMATDKNADGYYTPGYDVTVRINDAWGVRDTLRSGTLFSGKYEGWMTKVRFREHRVLPPLPADSPVREGLGPDPAGAVQNAVYVLRPYPLSSVVPDATLKKLIAAKEIDAWPVEVSSTTFAPVLEALQEGRELKPISVAYRYDGSPSLAFAFPLLIFKNVHDPLTGGYVVNRLYFRDNQLRHWGWMLMYTPSASRWFDEYAAAGIETDSVDAPEGTPAKTRTFAGEVGVKFRFRAPNRVFGALFDFWGVRMGVKATGAVDIEHLSYVVEFGAGVW